MNIDHLFVKNTCVALAKICGVDYSSGISELTPHIGIGDYDPHKRKLKEDGFEALGVYFFTLGDRITKDFSFSNCIELYRRSIEDCASELGCRNELIKDVVLIHELAHSVQHLGRSAGPGCKSKNWIYEAAFPSKSDVSFDMKRGDKTAGHTKRSVTPIKQFLEHLAQSATFLILHEQECHEALWVFGELSNRCPPQYRTWEEYRILLRECSIKKAIEYFQTQHADFRREVERWSLGVPLEDEDIDIINAIRNS